MLEGRTRRFRDVLRMAILLAAILNLAVARPVSAAGCGDSILNPGEECDDGNATAGDGCEDDCTVSANCQLFASTDVPQTIVTAATSTLNVSLPGSLASIQIVNLQGVHTYVSDLVFHLTNPGGTAVTFLDTICGGITTNIDLSLGDSAATPVPCPPNDGGFHLPGSSMAPLLGGSPAGTWTLSIDDSFPAADDGTLSSWGLLLCSSCGNGTLDPGEQCDDGNATAGDGCEDDCTISANCHLYSSSDVPKSINDLATATSILNVPLGGSLSSVQVLGLQGTHTHVSDLVFSLMNPSGTDVVLIDRVCSGDQDFNLSVADLATSSITCPPTDAGLHAPANPLAPLIAGSPTGNWTLNVSDTSIFDSGNLGAWGLLLCSAPSCGNGILDAGEQCDDGNATARDGCENDCTFSPPCGNGTIDSGEECDDGNATAGDGCDNDCTASANCQLFASTDVPQSIVTTATSNLNVSLTDSLASIQIVNLQGVHTFVSDLVFHLTNPGGTAVTFLDTICGGITTNIDLSLGDSAATPVPCPPNDGGFHLPGSSLAPLVGGSPAGTWTLSIDDSFPAEDDGTLSSWGLLLCRSCGNGTLDPGEQCDDGNVADGDCCGSTCQYELTGSACDDANACTQADACNGVGTCAGATPTDCDDGNVCTEDSCIPATGCVNDDAPATSCLHSAGSQLFAKSDAGDHTKDKLQWKWTKGDAVTQGELADPTASTAYDLCVFAGPLNALVASAGLEPGQGWSAIGDKGYKFKGQNADGLTGAMLQSGAASKSKASVKGKGADLPDLTLPFSYPVTVQLRKAGSSLCLESTFTMSDELKNEAGLFKAKH